MVDRIEVQPLILPLPPPSVLHLNHATTNLLKANTYFIILFSLERVSFKKITFNFPLLEIIRAEMKPASIVFHTTINSISHLAKGVPALGLVAYCTVWWERTPVYSGRGRAFLLIPFIKRLSHFTYSNLYAYSQYSSGQSDRYESSYEKGRGMEAREWDTSSIPKDRGCTACNGDPSSQSSITRFPLLTIISAYSDCTAFSFNTASSLSAYRWVLPEGKHWYSRGKATKIRVTKWKKINNTPAASPNAITCRDGENANAVRGIPPVSITRGIPELSFKSCKWTWHIWTIWWLWNTRESEINLRHEDDLSHCVWGKKSWDEWRERKRNWRKMTEHSKIVDLELISSNSISPLLQSYFNIWISMHRSSSKWCSTRNQLIPCYIEVYDWSTVAFQHPDINHLSPFNKLS